MASSMVLAHAKQPLGTVGTSTGPETSADGQSACGCPILDVGLAVLVASLADSHPGHAQFATMN